MIAPQLGRLLTRQNTAFHRDRVGIRHIERGTVDLLAIDRDQTGFDQPFGIAPRADACPRDPLGNAFATLAACFG